MGVTNLTGRYATSFRASRQPIQSHARARRKFPGDKIFAGDQMPGKHVNPVLQAPMNPVISNRVRILRPGSKVCVVDQHTPAIGIQQACVDRDRALCP